MHTNNLKWLPLALLFASLLALASCDEELEVYSSEYSDTVVFGIQPDRASRAAADDDAVVSRFYLTDEQNADSMLVSCEVSDMPAFASLAPRTRASYVDNSSMESFGVFAYLATTGVAADTWNWSSFFFTDQEVNRPSDATGLWQMANTYYWFGDDANSLRFFAYSPYDVNATLPASDQAATAPYITYSVPDDAASQTDLMVAVSDVTSGNHNAAASLNFKHLLSAVEFQCGTLNGATIKDVRLTGIPHSSGTCEYNPANGSWNWEFDDETSASYTAYTGADGSNTGDGQDLTDDKSVLMLMPQAFENTSALIEVDIITANGGESKKITSPIPTQWAMGKRYNYKINIAPDYSITITVPEEDKVQDAHYVSFPITVDVKDFIGSWTLTSNLPDAVFFTASQTDLQKQGYWIDEDKGQASVTGTGSGTSTYYVYVTENIGDVARDIKLQITPADNAQAVPVTANVQQLCPSWNGTLGCERIEDGDYPWGFYWTDDYKVVYDMTACSKSDRESISVYIRWTQILHTIFPNWFPTDISYVDHKYEGGFLGMGSSTTTVTINFGQLNIANIAISEDNGLANTKELYNFNGISQVADIISRLEACSDFQVSQSGNGLLNPTEYAARACALNNKYTKQTNQGNDIAVLPDADFVWYLPSKNEFSSISDTEKPLAGEYWTSTADNQSNENAYKANSSTNTTSLDLRNAIMNVRAVRKKP